jgi:hypothetical protein
VMAQQDWYAEQGLVKQKVGAAQVVDDGFVQAAAAQLGPYR